MAKLPTMAASNEPVRETARRGIKGCVANWPEGPFKDEFQRDCPSLEMQKMTRRDIERFVRAQFSKSQAVRDLNNVLPEGIARLINDVVTTAEGVFLWDNLVVRTLLITASANSSLFTLQQQLDKIPSDIMGLYGST
ncbi:hypothetical protein VTK26DRAFT_1799 [Humicola hyalothermophila]